MKNKKGVLIALTLVILTLVIFSLSSLLVIKDQRESLFIQASFERVNNLDESIQKSITDIIKHEGNISINITKNNITITENIPKNIPNIQSEISDYLTYYNSEFSEVNITSNIQLLRINLTPQGVEYSHSSSGQQINITNINSVEEINLNFNFNQVGLVCPLSWNTQVAGSMLINITVNDNSINCATEISIDPSSSSGSQIELAHSQGNITVNIKNNNIDIIRSTTQSYTAVTKISFKEYEKIVDLRIPEIKTNVNFHNFSISGSARFLT